MIYIPPITQILEDKKAASRHIQKEIDSLFLQFIDKETYPTFIWLKSAYQKTEVILAKRAHARLVYSATENIQQSVAVARISELYSSEELEHISDLSDLEEVFSFTHWLREKYSGLLSLEVCQVTNRVWCDARYAFRGSHIHTGQGVLFLSYQDEYNRSRIHMYQYTGDIKADGGVEYHYKKLPKLDISVCTAEQKQLHDSPRVSSVISVVSVRSSIPASFSDVVAPTISYLLSRKMQELAG